MKKVISLMLALSLILALGTSFSIAAPAVSDVGFGLSSFGQALESRYKDPDRVFSSEARWWLGTASHTDETLLEEIQAYYDGGFRGAELCMQSAPSGAANATYAYGSAMWSHKWKLMMNKFLDLGMTVSLTSGTNWSTSNVPGLNPDSQEASQVIAMGTSTVNYGSNLTTLPQPSTRRNVAQFIGAYAYLQTASNVYDYSSGVELTSLVTQGSTVWTQDLTWTPPSSGTWRIFAYWSQGNYITASPAAETCYATNYFDKRGVAALRTFWEANYLNEPELNKKILNGDVQLFMDSLELNPTGGITWWTEAIRQEFIDRKGYDILPYIFLTSGLPQVQAVYNPYYEPAKGTYDLADNVNLREKIINDWVDILTQLYNENLLLELKSWLNSVGIKTRAQISYGRSFEITEPSMYVDYPEAEGFNQYNQVDIFRLHTAGSKLQNKVLSAESGTSLFYGANHQLNYRDAYSYYAAGFSRMIWHIWTAEYGYTTATGTPPTAWPGYTSGSSGFQRFGNRYPSSRDWDEFNGHLGRIQQLLREGKARTDIGFIHNNWNQGLRFGGDKSKFGGSNNSGFAAVQAMNWEFAHMGVYYRSTELQNNGYTYDYLSPKMLLDAPEVYFDENTKTIELAGYKALVLYQDWLDIRGAQRILEWAKKGLPVVIIDGAAVRTPFDDGKDANLAAIIAELETLPTVRRAAIYDASSSFNYFKPIAEGYSDGVLEALQDLGVRPYAGYKEPNHQLLTQSRQDADGNLYLYAYNYCPNNYHAESLLPSVMTEDHGTNIKTEIKMDGKYVPYSIDAWSGKATELGYYRYENGQTVFPIDLDYGNIALYAFEAVGKEKLHVVSTDAQSAYAVPGNLVVRATESGLYNTILSNGVSYKNDVTVPDAYDITDWNLDVVSWTASTTVLRRAETIGSLTTYNAKYATATSNINVSLPTLTTWNNISQIGRAVSGTSLYTATFNWDASKADGAYLNLGDTLIDAMKVKINGVKVGGDVSTNPTKVKRSVGVAIDGEVPEGRDIYTGGISQTKPVCDIGPYLVDGVNTIEIQYDSGLTNIMISRGVISAGTNPSRGWWGNYIKYENYGPSQAVIVPYVDQVITTASVIADIRADQAAVVVNNPASYTVSLDNTKGVGIVELSFTFDGYVLDKDSITATPLNGFAAGIYSPLTFQYLGQGVWKGTVKFMYLNNGYVNVDGPLDILKISGPAISTGPASVTLTSFSVSGDNGAGVGAMPSLIRTAEATVAIGSKPAVYSKYDLNKDGSIDETDLLYLVYFYQWNDRDADWDTKDLYGIFAKDCDFQINGKVDLADMIELTANYGIYDPYDW